MVKTHMSASLGMPTPGLDHSLQMMPDGNSGVNPSLLGDFDLFSASAYQAELDYLSFPFMDSFLAESAGDLTFALASAMDSQPSYSSGSSSPPGSSSPRTPATPHQQSFQPSSSHDQRAWSVNNTDSSSDPDSPSSLFTENIFSPSFIPKPPRNQYFPSDERSDNGEGNGEILMRLLDLQARISKLVKHLHGGLGSSIDCEEVLNAGQLLISLLDSVGAPSRFLSSSSSSPFSDSRTSEPASPMFSSSSRSTSSSSTSSALLSSENTIPSNVLILSLSSCYATLLHAYELLADRLHHQQQQHSHSHCQKYVSGIQTPLLSPASSISSFSPIEQQQGYFFSSNGLRHQARQPLDGGNNAHLHAMAQMVQKLKHTLQRCMGRMGQGSGSRSNGALGAKKKKKQNPPNVHLDSMESCCGNASNDDLLMSLSKPALLEMGWGEEELWQGMNW